MSARVPVIWIAVAPVTLTSKAYAEYTLDPVYGKPIVAGGSYHYRVSPLNRFECARIKYNASQFERWIAAYGGGVIWYYDSTCRKLVECLIYPHETYVESSSFYRHGEEHVVGGYWKTSKKYVDLYVRSIVSIEDVIFDIHHFPGVRFEKSHRIPSGEVARLIDGPKEKYYERLPA
ncbi:hypothetical protein BAMBUS_01000 [Brevundimonas phage vB_BpoS-Bambus]|nr:hypothetical protein BAMBUS_01000 [Brevundimonas phage vB_BpoS-Bambus]